jgi:DNA-directed RNA polymerase specialized sigma24 family protein
VLLDEAVSSAPGRALSLDPALEREFEERLADSSTLAFRVALGVLRRREDAEDVAQEVFLRAHRAFA